MAAGGATGVDITALEPQRPIKKALILKLASGPCADGQILSGVKYNYMAPAPIRSDDGEPAARLNDIFMGLERNGTADLLRDGYENDAITISRGLDMSCFGQIHGRTVATKAFEIIKDKLYRNKQACHTRHKELYSFNKPHTSVEVVSAKSMIVGDVSRCTRKTIVAGGGAKKFG